jgi:hypothetical protein
MFPLIQNHLRATATVVTGFQIVLNIIVRSSFVFVTFEPNVIKSLVLQEIEDFFITWLHFPIRLPRGSSNQFYMNIILIRSCGYFYAYILVILVLLKLHEFKTEHEVHSSVLTPQETSMPPLIHCL